MTDESNPSEGEDHLSAELELVAQACQYLPGSLGRARFLDKLIREIVKSGQLWKENAPYYEEALQKTWTLRCVPKFSYPIISRVDSPRSPCTHTPLYLPI